MRLNSILAVTLLFSALGVSSQFCRAQEFGANFGPGIYQEFEFGNRLNLDPQSRESWFVDFCQNASITLVEESSIPYRDLTLVGRTIGQTGKKVYCELSHFRISEINELLRNAEFAQRCPSFKYEFVIEEDRNAFQSSSLNSSTWSHAPVASFRLFCEGGAPR